MATLHFTAKLRRDRTRWFLQVPARDVLRSGLQEGDEVEVRVEHLQPGEAPIRPADAAGAWEPAAGTA